MGVDPRCAHDVLNSGTCGDSCRTCVRAAEQQGCSAGSADEVVLAPTTQACVGWCKLGAHADARWASQNASCLSRAKSPCACTFHQVGP